MSCCDDLGRRSKLSRRFLTGVIGVLLLVIARALYRAVTALKHLEGKVGNSLKEMAKSLGQQNSALKFSLFVK